MPRRILDVIIERLRKRGFRAVEGKKGMIEVVPRGQMFTRSQEEKIFEVADSCGAKVHSGKIIITKPKGRVPSLEVAVEHLEHIKIRPPEELR